MRTPSRLLFAVALSMLAACAPDEPPARTPTGPSSLGHLGVASALAPGCDKEGAHALINKVYPEGRPRDAAHDELNLLCKRYEEGNTAGAWESAVVLINDLRARLAAGTVTNDMERVAALLAEILQCAGKGEVAVSDAQAFLEGTSAVIPLADPAVDGFVALAKAGEPLAQVVPSGRFAIEIDEANKAFFEADAIVQIGLRPVDDVVQVRVPSREGSESEDWKVYPPAYQITVTPYDAQVNYDPKYPPPSDGPTAEVALCHDQGDNHGEFLDIIRIPDAGDIHPLYATEYTGTLLRCGGNELKTETAFGDALLRYLGRGVRTVAWFAFPEPAHARRVDGGMGGDTFLFSGFVAAEPIADTTTEPVP